MIERNSTHRLRMPDGVNRHPIRPCPLIPSFSGLVSASGTAVTVYQTRYLSNPGGICAALTGKAHQHPERTTERPRSRFAVAILRIQQTRQTGIFHHGEVLLQILWERLFERPISDQHHMLPSSGRSRQGQTCSLRGRRSPGIHLQILREKSQHHRLPDQPDVPAPSGRKRQRASLSLALIANNCMQEGVKFITSCIHDFFYGGKQNGQGRDSSTGHG